MTARCFASSRIGLPVDCWIQHPSINHMSHIWLTKKKWLSWESVPAKPGTNFKENLESWHITSYIRRKLFCSTCRVPLSANFWCVVCIFNFIKQDAWTFRKHIRKPMLCLHEVLQALAVFMYKTLRSCEQLLPEVYSRLCNQYELELPHWRMRHRSPVCALYAMVSSKLLAQWLSDDQAFLRRRIGSLSECHQALQPAHFVRFWIATQSRRSNNLLSYLSLRSTSLKIDSIPARLSNN